MPLITIVGFPRSGKTTYAKQLQKYLQENIIDNSEQQGKHKFKSIYLASDDDLFSNANATAQNATNSSKQWAYENSFQEKMARGTLKAAVHNKISNSCIVICDSLNYIKGFRYELFCIAREHQTPHCTVYLDTSSEDCMKWNQEHPIYKEQTLKELFMRMEIPDETRRWDKPLFVIKNPPTEDSTPISQIFNSIAQHLLSQQDKMVPHQATLPQQLSHTNLLHELDQMTNQIIQILLQVKQTATPGDMIKISDLCPNEKVKMPNQIQRTITIMKLKELKKGFIQLAQMQPPQSQVEAIKMFVAYLNSNLA